MNNIPIQTQYHPLKTFQTDKKKNKSQWQVKKGTTAQVKEAIIKPNFMRRDYQNFHRLFC